MICFNVGATDNDHLLYYFELERSWENLHIGYLDASLTPPKLIAIEVSGGKLTCRDKENILEFETHKTIGCGILWPSNVIVVTVDGDVTLHSGEVSSTSIVSYLPYVSSGYDRLNFGDKVFQYEKANFQRVKIEAADALMNILNELDLEGELIV